MKQGKSFVVLVILCSALCICAEIHAGSLKISKSTYDSISNLQITDHNFLLCGDAQIGSTSKYMQNFFQGNPQRGFLITPPLLIDDIKSIIRNEPDRVKLIQILTEQFSQMEMIAVDPKFEKITRSGNAKVEVYVPEKLHACLVDYRKKWGCGVTENRNDECCEKKLGSPFINITWNDNIRGESYSLIYKPEAGYSRLIRRNNDIETIYYCIISEAFFITN